MAVVEDVVDLLQTAAVIARRKAGEERREPRWPPLDVGIQLKTPPRPPARLFRRRGERMFERLKAAEQLRNVEGSSPVIGVGSSGKQGVDLTGTLMRGKERLFDWNGTRSPGMKN
jgi:hypothetical protein